MNRRSGVYHRNDVLYLKVAKPPLVKGAQVFVSGVYSGGIQRHAPNTSTKLARYSVQYRWMELKVSEGIVFKVKPEGIDIPGVDYKKRKFAFDWDVEDGPGIVCDHPSGITTHSILFKL